jgi:predicted permease
MRLLRSCGLWARSLFRRSQVEADLNDELRDYVERQTERYLAKGLSPEQARAAALRDVDGIEQVKENCRDVRATAWIENARQDIRCACRTLRKNWGFALAAVSTLALGIGANTAMFGVVDGVLLRSLPFPEPSQLVRIMGDVVRQQASLVALRDGSRTTDYGAYSENTEFNFTGHGEPKRLVGCAVTANLFSVLRQAPLAGRAFLAGEDLPGNDGVAILSYSFWQNEFRGDPSVVGRIIKLDEADRRVVGVMPRTFRFPSLETEIWVPTRIDRRNVGMYWWTYNLNIVGRLRQGFTIQQAEAELRTFIPRIRDSFAWRMWPDWGQKAHLVNLQETLIGDVRTRLLILLSVVALVLLIACANVANLVLARSASRQRELSLRAALGASRTRILRQLLTESLVLAVLGAGVGLAVAFVVSSVFWRVLPTGLAQLGDKAIDLRVLGFTGLLAVGTGLGFGMLPAFRSLRADVQNALRSEDRAISGSRSRMRMSNGLVAFEVAIGVVVVIGAGLLARSFWELINVDPGFQTDHRLTALVTPNPSLCNTAGQCVAFYDELLSRTRPLPGVQSVAAVSPLPLSGNIGGAALELQDHPVLPGHSAPTLWVSSVTPDYFATMGISILSGRVFRDSDREVTELVAVVTAATAKHWWPNENPIGKHVRYVSEKSLRTVVGVVRDTKDAALSGDPGWMEGHFYLPYAQSGANLSPRLAVVLKTGVDPLSLSAPFRRLVSEIHKDVPVTEIRNMEEVISQSVSTSRSTLWLFLSFAALALVLSSVGIYAMFAYTVAQRTREIGIRMALGAPGKDIVQGILAHSFIITSIGLMVGIAAAYASTRFLRSLLFLVPSHDVVTFIAIPTLLLVFALVATYVPARRATKVDPVLALRHE